jgi:acetyl-CoA carboxylase biotin carboxylase subunit
MRKKMGEVAVEAARACGYVNAGTVEFLVDADRNFYFLEMNTRLQVEHPITEMVTGIDLVRQQILIAEGKAVSFKDVPRRGAAVECRIYAEDPANNFLPSPGLIKAVTDPGGPGVRNDSGVYTGYTIPMEYDPMISKLVTWAEDRPQAMARMLRALEEYHLLGIRTNIPYLRRIIQHPKFQAGNYDTLFITNHQEELLPPDQSPQEPIALAAAAILSHLRDKESALAIPTGDETVSAWKLFDRLRRQI